MPKKNNKPEVVVITGGTAGIGRAAARRFANHGAKLAILARGAAGLEATKQEIENLGGEALTIATDVADADAVESAAEQVEEKFGPIDIWVNNAMTSVFSPISEMKPEEYKRVTEVTYLGQVYGTLAALKRMKPRDEGCIVFVGSALAYRGIPLQSAYCGAKHAIEGFYDSLRSELIHEKSGVRVTMVHPPGVNTPQFDWVKSRLPRKPRPLGAVYQPEIIADAIYWAAHNDRREIVVGYPALQAIWGEKFAPAYADKKLAEVGFDGQQREEPDDPERPYNLWAPVDAEKDFGAHGVFDSEARTFSPVLWATENRDLLTTVAIGAAGALATVVLAEKFRKRLANGD